MLKNREILKNIKKWLFEKEIVILNGSRQAGKTSLLKLINRELLKSGISEQNIFYLNLEEVKILDILNKDPENLISYIVNPKKRNYFLMDEIQYLDNPSNFLKHIYDKYAPNIKIIATGSSVLELKAKFQDSLAGRKVSFLIKPLSFKEFLQFQNFDYLNYFDRLKIPDNIKYDFDKALNEYLIYGGMPAVVLQNNKEKKQKMLNEYVDTYINKDVRMIGKIKNIAGFNNLIKILSSQIGNLLNISELSNATGISRRKVEEYLSILEYTFVLEKIAPFRKNLKAQILKMPKLYFFDIGIRNAILGNFLNIDARSDAGALFENFIYSEIKNKADANIFFYRTVSKSEIDFVVEKGDKIIPIEAKFKKLTKKIDTRVIKNFLSHENNAKKFFVINLSFLEVDNNIQYVDYRNISDLLN